MNRIVISGLVGVHLAAAVWHGEAHADLAIDLPPPKDAFIYLVIVSAPLVAVVLAWTRYESLALWVFTLFGDNLTDERYIVSGGSNKPDFGLAYATYARPRTWGLSARYGFGDSPN